MGKIFNPNVLVTFSVHDESSVEALGVLSEKQFVLAKPETQAKDTRLSLVVIGSSPEAVEVYLEKASAPGPRNSPLKHALEDLRSCYLLGKLESKGAGNKEFAALSELPPLGGCCTTSDGVSVLVVHRAGGEEEFRQALLLDKTVVCDFDGEDEPRKLLGLTVRNRRPGDRPQEPATGPLQKR